MVTRILHHNYAVRFWNLCESHTLFPALNHSLRSVLSRVHTLPIRSLAIQMKSLDIAQSLHIARWTILLRLLMSVFHDLLHVLISSGELCMYTSLELVWPQ